MLEVAGKNHLVEHSLCGDCLTAHRDTLDEQVRELENAVAWDEAKDTDERFHRDSYRGAV